MSSVVPIIDLSLANAGELMLRACRDHGLFYIDNRRGQEIDIDIIDNIMKLSKKFHQLPQEIKQKYAIEQSQYHRGYLSQKSMYHNRHQQKNTLNQFTFDQQKPTSSESFNFCSENWLRNININNKNDKIDQTTSTSNCNTNNNTNNDDGNMYPVELGRECYDLIQQYKNYCIELHHKIFHHLKPFVDINNVKSSDYDINKWEDAFTDLSWMFRWIYYPPLNGELCPHTDKGVLTILIQDEVSGLQAWWNNEWIDVPPIKNTFFVNIADMMQEISGGTFKSTLHRVVNNGNAERYSIPFFLQLGKSVQAYIAKDDIWYSQYQHLCEHQYRIYHYLSSTMDTSGNIFKDMSHQQIDQFHQNTIAKLRTTETTNETNTTTTITTTTTTKPDQTTQDS